MTDPLEAKLLITHILRRPPETGGWGAQASLID